MNKFSRVRIDKYCYGIIIVLVSALIFLGQVGCRPAQKAEPGPKPPVAEKIKKELTANGQTRIDEYFWLRERENPKVLDYLKAENDYEKAVMKHTEPFQDALYKEIIGRIKQTDLSVPYKDNGYFYYTRFEEAKDYPLYCRKKGKLDAAEEVLLNGPLMAEGKSFFSIGGLSVSPDNKLCAYGVDTVSRRKYTLYFKILATGQVLPDEIATTTGSAAWASDNKTVFYTVKDDTTLRSYKIMQHVLGTPASADAEIYMEKDETYDVGVYLSRSKKYLIIDSGSTLSDESRFLEANNPNGKFKVIQPRQKDLKYSVEHFKDKFFIMTNDQAKNFRLMATPVTKTTKDNWTEVIPHRADVLLEDFAIFNNFLVLHERKMGLPQLRILTWADKSEHYLDFGEATYAAGLSTNPEFDTDVVRYRYASLTTPNSTFDYNMKSKQKTLLKQEEVLGGFDPKNYHAERLYAVAKDGVQVPISLVYRVGFEKNGQGPCLLYGYGSYGASSDPGFSSARLSLLDRGFVYAIAHIRGGQEMGRWWYEDGKLLKKKNTFTDFIACSEYLIAQKFTRPEKLFAMGGSAGGLLMGAVVNIRPDLFKGVVASVPWVDVVTTMLDSSVPLTTSEYDEWGNPNTKEYYDYMLSYSPYDNVEKKAYPAMLVTTGLQDSQVQYWEPAKWVAKLRAMKTDKNILLLVANMEAGHGGASGRFRRLKETALQFSFMLDLAGITK
ncbi:MAG: S9 family peptidase [Candidatus Aminicenantes bacterium]|nr:S9 family peptidase [Candidatus Aminicenantes bacterium]